MGDEIENGLELHRLCAQVYRATGWDTFPDAEGVKINGRSPLYTSDFLLEKLPYKIADKGFLTLSRGNISAVASYQGTGGNQTIWYRDKTPLLALLKLTLALHDAKEVSIVKESSDE